ncbi:hypothetical protein M3589_23905 [Heyndrickxia oleronia]|uniref:hypothetical protein n=1 Tax=Heyndrickxia oleronia TaxID=38875 RepID=UPI00203F7134|nr:hypothetical protein [Heyndrickxia oleronia]MCM3240704.1 hypothetical protein [Heyndrickxia oleronia]
MNTSKIEEIAVAAIKNEVLRSNFLANDIPVNDKTPSWDGEIWVYNKTSQKKDQLFGKVPIQVKGKQVSEIHKNVKYSVNKADLENYFKNGGVIFFVVEIVSIDQTQIFYLDLLPIDLKKIVEDMKGRNSVTKTFKKLGTGKSTLEFICRNFIKHSRKQGLSVLIDKDLPYDNIKLEFITSSQEDFKDHLLEYGTYAYGHIEPFNLDIPLYKMDIQVIEEDTDLWVGFNDEKRYTNIVRATKREKISLKFGQGFEIILPKNFTSSRNSRESFKINFKESGTIYERIKDCRFMLDIISNQSINIYGANINLRQSEVEKVEYKFQGLSRYIYELEKIVEMFDRLHIQFNEDLKHLTANDWKTINALIHIVLHNNYSSIKFGKKNPLLQFQVANIKIVLFTTNVNGKLAVFNLFDFENLKKHFKILALMKENTQTVEHSPFLLIDPSYLLEISNFDHKVVEASFKTLKDRSDDSATLTNQYMLEILKYYDKHPHRKELLLLTLNIFDSLATDHPNNILYFLNKMQVIKRMRMFTDEEKEILIDLKLQYKYEVEIMCAFSILLEGKIEFEVNFNRLSKEEREQFCNYPIYNLMKN